MGYKKSIALIKEILADPNEARGTVWQGKAEEEVKKFDDKKSGYQNE